MARRNNKGLQILTIVILIALAIVVIVGTQKSSTTYTADPLASSTSSNSVVASSSPSQAAGQDPEIVIDQIAISVDVSSTTTEIDKGLSGRPSLGADDGMLFLFKKPALYKFWMPDMHFPLDMIWIGSDEKIVDISKDVPTAFDPAAPIFYKPKAPAQYVLEVNADFAAAHGIQIGDAVTFEYIPLNR